MIDQFTSTGRFEAKAVLILLGRAMESILVICGTVIEAVEGGASRRDVNVQVSVPKCCSAGTKARALCEARETSPLEECSSIAHSPARCLSRDRGQHKLARVRACSDHMRHRSLQRPSAPPQQNDRPMFKVHLRCSSLYRAVVPLPHISYTAASLGPPSKNPPPQISP